MSNPDEPPHWVEYPSLERAPHPVDPYAPVDYPNDYPDHPGLPPAGAGAFGHQAGYAGQPAGYPGPYGGYGAGPYDPYGPNDPYGQSRPAGTNGKAIGSLVTALVGLPLCFCFLPSVVAIVLGVIAMGETKRTNQEGHGLAVAGVVIGAASLALTVIILAVGIATNTNYSND